MGLSLSESVGFMSNRRSPFASVARRSMPAGTRQGEQRPVAGSLLRPGIEGTGLDGDLLGDRLVHVHAEVVALVARREPHDPFLIHVAAGYVEVGLTGTAFHRQVRLEVVAAGEEAGDLVVGLTRPHLVVVRVPGSGARLSGLLAVEPVAQAAVAVHELAAAGLEPVLLGEQIFRHVGQLAAAVLVAERVAYLVVGDLGAALGQDLDDAGACAGTVERRGCGALHDLDALDVQSVQVHETRAHDDAVDDVQGLLVTAAGV
jgi:hypothetical protein